jgi:N-methylhydantoinase B
MSALDPVSLALVQNRLDHVARQMGWVMVRTSRSPIFNQSHDFSCFITDGQGTLVSQADGIPIHTGGGGFAVRALLGVFANAIDPGDVFLLNDPYVAGGNHLPDWVVAYPVIVDGVVVAFTCNRAHQSDIGGGAAGTYNPEATEIFHEGIRLPPLKLIRKGEIDDGLWRLLLLNTRTPHLLDGDLRAMIGSARIGGEEVFRLVSDLGRETALQHFQGILQHADRRLRSLLSQLPDGEFCAEERFDTDCFEPMDIPIRVRLAKSGDQLTVDFTGTHEQIRGFKNSSLANTYSAVYAGLASFFDADLPRNEGTFRAVEIIAPEGSLVNARAPAPLTMCTVFPAHEIMHVIWWALAAADPTRALAGWGKNSFPISSGRDSRDRVWVMYHWGGNSGGGAATTRDGFNQMGPMITLGGLTIPNAETYERLYPVTVRRHELRCDGGGAGTFRGGTGVDYEVDIETPSEFSFRAEGTMRPTGLGVLGGHDGQIGWTGVTETGGETRATPPYGLMRAGPAKLQVRSPGGGGVGDPLLREVAKVVRDVRDGLVSVDAARDAYGVVMAPGLDRADAEATAALRDEMRRARPAPPFDKRGKSA